MMEKGCSVISSPRIGMKISKLKFPSSSLNVDEKVSMNVFNDTLLFEVCFEQILRMLEIFVNLACCYLVLCT